MKEQKRLCPFCKNNQFIRIAKDLVEITDDGQTMKDEPVYDCDNYEYTCSECKKNVTEEELVKE